MIFALAADGSSLFCMLSEADVLSMRDGRTKFVDHHQIGAATFKSVVFSLSKTDEESLALLQQAGANVKNLIKPEPAATEAKCTGCDAIMKAALLFEGTCTVCWATEAKKLRTASN